MNSSLKLVPTPLILNGSSPPVLRRQQVNRKPIRGGSILARVPLLSGFSMSRSKNRELRFVYMSRRPKSCLVSASRS